MRDFLLDEQDGAFRARAREVLEREVAPLAASIEDDEDWGALRLGITAVGGAGLLAPMFKERYEGSLSQPGLVHATIVSEEAAALNYAFETTIATTLSCAFAVDRFAAPALRERYLQGLTDGRALGAICVTEAQAGSDTSAITTRIDYDEARREWVINGAKRYISNASVADTYVVYGGCAPAACTEGGLTAVVVPAATAGLAFPRRYHFMGRRGCIVGEVSFDDCRVPADHLLGERGGGLQIMRSMFNFERVVLGGAGLGIGRSAFELARARAQTRVAFGQPLGAKQLIWSQIAEMSWRLDAAELLTYRAAKMYDEGTAARRDLMRAAAIAKLTASETAIFCADAMVQILGADGLTKEYGRAEQIYRDARALTIVGGTSEMAKYLIARVDLPQIKVSL